ncbi:MAG: transketolase [Phycisphaerae bacterium]|nr:transketolase [Phycisphaerae bacterium]
MICRAGSGHLGGALSLVEIVMTLYRRVMRIAPENPEWPQRDRLIVSKGHAGPVVYIALAHAGFFPANWLKTLNADGTRLPSHCDQSRTPGIDMTTGSLGQGLSCACGLALAGRMDGKKHRLFCIVGDGECQEGQIWEAAMFAGHHKLDNLVAITDYNQLQIDGFVKDINTLEPLVARWRAFGWEVFEINGHDWDDIYNGLNKGIAVTGKPAMIIAHTIKGKGCREIENKPESHNIKIADAAAYQKYMNALEVTDVTLPY